SFPMFYPSLALFIGVCLIEISLMMSLIFLASSFAQLASSIRTRRVQSSSKLSKNGGLMKQLLLELLLLLLLRLLLVRLLIASGTDVGRSRGAAGLAAAQQGCDGVGVLALLQAEPLLRPSALQLV
uniref:NADH-ubiquinone oxidoreductase chain 1 n=1 Tax=Macrostomum lignano TaxID=282301 RepID=A0A1I8JCE5_9PLAT